jgi:hypothetical protein
MGLHHLSSHQPPTAYNALVMVGLQAQAPYRSSFSACPLLSAMDTGDRSFSSPSSVLIFSTSSPPVSDLCNDPLLDLWTSRPTIRAPRVMGRGRFTASPVAQMVGRYQFTASPVPRVVGHGRSTASPVPRVVSHGRSRALPVPIVSHIFEYTLLHDSFQLVC